MITKSLSCQKQLGTEPFEKSKTKRILLLGNAQSSMQFVFSKLSGIEPFKEMPFQSGKIVIQKESFDFVMQENQVLLDDTSIKLLQEGAEILILVLDTTQLKTGFELAMECKKYNIPIIYIFSSVYQAKQMGIDFDLKAISSILQSNVILLEQANSLLLLRKQLKKIQKDEGLILQQDTKQIYQQLLCCVFQRQVGQKKLKKIRWNANLFCNKLESILRVYILIITFLCLLKASINEIFEPVAEIFINFFQNGISKIFSNGVIKQLLIGDYGLLVTPFRWGLALWVPFLFLFCMIKYLLIEIDILKICQKFKDSRIFLLWNQKEIQKLKRYSSCFFFCCCEISLLVILKILFPLLFAGLGCWIFHIAILICWIVLSIFVGNMSFLKKQLQIIHWNQMFRFLKKELLYRFMQIEFIFLLICVLMAVIGLWS